MPDTPLSITRDDLLAEMGYRAGLGATAASWSAADAIRIRRCMDAAMRNLFVHPDVNIVGKGFQWSFLKPLLVISTVADQAVYDLPYDFGSQAGTGSFGTTQYWCPVTFVSESMIRQSRTISDAGGKPVRAAISAKRGMGVLGQVCTIEFYPTPDGAYQISFPYNLHPAALTSENPYPPGGVMMAEALRKACLRQVEIDILRGSQQTDTTDYANVLAAACEADKQRRPDSLGISRDVGNIDQRSNPHDLGNITFTFNGVTYS